MKGDKLIRLRQAADISGYHPDYLSYLIRNKKLLGIRKGHNWFVYEKELKAYLEQRLKEQKMASAPLSGSPIRRIKKSGFKQVNWPWLAFTALALFLLLANYIYGIVSAPKVEASKGDANGATKVIQTFYDDQGSKAISASAH